LWEAGIKEPPVDAFLVADRLAFVITHDEQMPQRARFVRLAEQGRPGGGQATIVLGPAARPERHHWAVAHEIGESVAYRVFETLGVRPEVAPLAAREHVASRLACCLLLPTKWFADDGRSVGWDLPGLKERYATASHELIARRMLDMPLPVVITVCDLGSVHWRRSNVSSRVPPMTPAERDSWQRCHVIGRPTSISLDPEITGLEMVHCWPIHEPDWKREILRSEVVDW
jgi:hypothetical protein